jgi:hypothetical protein
MTHSELVKIAERWLLKTRGCGFVFTELRTNAGEIPDAIGWRSDFSILVEVKVSLSDFRADAFKPFRQNWEMGVGDIRYYMTPKGLIEEFPTFGHYQGWGLVEVAENGRCRVKNRAPNDLGQAMPLIRHHEVAANERLILYSALRRLHIRGRIPEIYLGIPTEAGG